MTMDNNSRTGELKKKGWWENSWISTKKELPSALTEGSAPSRSHYNLTNCNKDSPNDLIQSQTLVLNRIVF